MSQKYTCFMSFDFCEGTRECPNKNECERLSEINKYLIRDEEGLWVIKDDEKKGYKVAYPLPYTYNQKKKQLVIKVWENYDYDGYDNVKQAAYRAGFDDAEELVVRKIKNEIRVVRDMVCHGFAIADKLESSPLKKGYYTYNHILPEYLLDRHQLREQGIKWTVINELVPDAKLWNGNKHYKNLYDIRKLQESTNLPLLN